MRTAGACRVANDMRTESVSQSVQGSPIVNVPDDEWDNMQREAVTGPEPRIVSTQTPYSKTPIPHLVGLSSMQGEIPGQVWPIQA